MGRGTDSVELLAAYDSQTCFITVYGRWGIGMGLQEMEMQSGVALHFLRVYRVQSQSTLYCILESTILNWKPSHCHLPLISVLTSYWNILIGIALSGHHFLFTASTTGRSPLRNSHPAHPPIGVVESVKELLLASFT
jgi:hypothetical protein